MEWRTSEQSSFESEKATNVLLSEKNPFSFYPDGNHWRNAVGISKDDLCLLLEHTYYAYPFPSG